MRTRRLISFLLGAWLASSLLLRFVENENLRSVERMLENNRNPVIKQLNSLGQNEAPNAVRFVIGEMNRSQTETFEWLQLLDLIVVAALLLTIDHGGRWSVILGCLMALLALSQRFIVTPEIDRMARQFEVLPVSAVSPERGRYFAFQTASNVSLFAMWMAGGVLVLRMMVGHSLRHFLLRDLDALEPDDLTPRLRPTRRSR